VGFVCGSGVLVVGRKLVGMASNQQTRPGIGELAKDSASGRIGVVMGEIGGRVQCHAGRCRRAQRSGGAKRTSGREERQQPGRAVMRAVGRYAGVLFIICVSGSCGLVIGVALGLGQ
jgi:hypothetical protein